MTSQEPSQPGRPRLLRAINERTLLDRLTRSGPASRAQLARETGLSKPTVSLALGNLERAGLVRALGHISPARGRTAVLYGPDPTAAYVLGIDIGRAWLRLAAADLGGQIVARRDVRNRARSAPALVREVSAVAHDLIGTAGVTWDQVAHTVVGGPGVYDPDSGRLRHAPNLPGWSRPGLMSALREALPHSVELDNDANLAALGERAYGQGREASNFVYLWVGTGIGLGIVLDGALYRGAFGAPGEVTSLRLRGPESSQAAARARARRRGMLEEAAAADAVVRGARALGMGGRLTAETVFAAARSGDERAVAAVDAEAGRLALVVGSVAAILDPELVILGGGVGANADLLRPRLERRLEGLSPLQPQIAEGELGTDAVVLGAIATALERAREVAFEQRAGVSAGPPRS